MLLENKHIFMVEDSALSIAIIRTALIAQGATVPYDHLGDTTLGSMLTYPFPLDLILLDLILPGRRSGYDIFNAIKANTKLQDVPIVAVSGSNPHEEIPQAQSLGFSGFIRKPVSHKLPHQIISILSGTAVWEKG